MYNISKHWNEQRSSWWGLGYPLKQQLSLNSSLNMKACNGDAADCDAALGYIMSRTGPVLWGVNCGETCGGVPTPGTLRGPRHWCRIMPFPSIRWPGSLQVNMKADPRAEPWAKPHPLHTLTRLYVCVPSPFFPTDPDTHILPQERRLSQCKRGSLFYWSASLLFSYGGGRKWGNLVDVLHRGAFKPTSVPQGGTLDPHN